MRFVFHLDKQHMSSNQGTILMMNGTYPIYKQQHHFWCVGVQYIQKKRNFLYSLVYFDLLMDMKYVEHKYLFIDSWDKKRTSYHLTSIPIRISRM